MEQLSVRVALVLLAAAFLASTSTMVAVSARYLPTRSQEDRLERLRELLKDLFDSDYDREHNRAYPPLPDVPVIPERAAIFKRSIPLHYPSGTDGQHEMFKGLMTSSSHGSPLVSGEIGAVGGNGMLQLAPAVFDSSYGNPDRKVIK